MDITNYGNAIALHYARVFGVRGMSLHWARGPIHELPEGFSVLQFQPTNATFAWVYATRCMSKPDDAERIELHLLSNREDQGLLELLYAVAHYHRTGASLGLGHTVNFGRPYQASSQCDHGLLSLPYPYGQRLEHLQVDRLPVRCLWLVPITKAERDFKIQQGLEALEQLFEGSKFNYLDPLRPSVV